MAQKLLAVGLVTATRQEGVGRLRCPLFVLMLCHCDLQRAGLVEPVVDHGFACGDNRWCSHQVISTEDGLHLSLAFVLGMAATIAMVQPYIQPQARLRQLHSNAWAAKVLYLLRETNLGGRQRDAPACQMNELHFFSLLCSSAARDRCQFLEGTSKRRGGRMGHGHSSVRPRSVSCGICWSWQPQSRAALALAEPGVCAASFPAGRCAGAS